MPPTTSHLSQLSLLNNQHVSREALWPHLDLQVGLLWEQAREEERGSGRVSRGQGEKK